MEYDNETKIYVRSIRSIELKNQASNVESTTVFVILLLFEMSDTKHGKLCCVASVLWCMSTVIMIFIVEMKSFMDYM